MTEHFGPRLEAENLRRLDVDAYCRLYGDTPVLEPVEPDPIAHSKEAMRILVEQGAGAWRAHIAERRAQLDEP